MTLTLLMGFSAIAGLMFGYFTARVRLWLVSLAMGSLCIIAGLLIYVWGTAQPDDWGLWNSIFFVGIAGPFVVCAVFAGLIAHLMRSLLSDPEDE